MRTLHSSKSLITFDNAQCRCFEAALPSKQFFLSKSQITTNPMTLKAPQIIPEKPQQALFKTSLKRSLKQLNSPARSQQVIHAQELSIDQSQIFKDTMLDSTKLPKYQNTSINQFQTTIPSSTTLKVSFKKPQYEYNRPLIQYNPSQIPQPFIYINPENQSLPSNKLITQPNKIQTSKINFNFAPKSAEKVEPPFPPNVIFKTQSMKTFIQPPPNPSVSGSIRIPKLERTHSRIQSSDLGMTQTITKHSNINSGLMPEPSRAQIVDKRQAKEAAREYKDLQQFHIKNQSNKNSQTTKLKQNSHKSVINTKRSLLTQTNRSKILAKKQRPRPALRKMQDVQEIHSLADSAEQQNSDKESVVLGRLNEFQSTTNIRTFTPSADQQYSLKFIEQGNSIIIDNPSGEWRHEIESKQSY